MKRLRGGIPRALRNHKTPEGRAYRTYIVALEARLGSLPLAARPFLREAGLIELELQRVAPLHERAVARNRLKEARTYRRTQTGLTRQLMRLESKLEQLAASCAARTPTEAALAIVRRSEAS